MLLRSEGEPAGGLGPTWALLWLHRATLSSTGMRELRAAAQRAVDARVSATCKQSRSRTDVVAAAAGFVVQAHTFA